MRSALFCRPALDLPSHVFSTKPFFTRKETAAESREEDSPACLSSILCESKSWPRNCRNTSRASTCFSRCRCCAPRGEEMAPGILGMCGTNATKTKLSFFMKSVKRAKGRATVREKDHSGVSLLTRRIGWPQQAKNGGLEHRINCAPQYGGLTQRAQSHPHNSVFTSLQKDFHFF
jgi:hypothetical protein